MRTIVYIDGYNLYYGLLRNSPFKWLDLYCLFQDHVLAAPTDVVEVRYYTSPVLLKMSDDPQSAQRQRIYLQALRKMPPQKLTIIEGKMIASTPWLRLVKPLPQVPELSRVQVYTLVEKHTDVSLATDLVTGAWTGAYEQAVICTNDTDIKGALAAIKQHHPGLQLGLVAPIPANDHRKIAAELQQYASWAKKLSVTHLANAQLPNRIPGTSITKPAVW